MAGATTPSTSALSTSSTSTPSSRSLASPTAACTWTIRRCVLVLKDRVLKTTLDGHQPLPGPRQRRRHASTARQGGAPCGRFLALRHRRPAAAEGFRRHRLALRQVQSDAFRSRATAPARRRSCSRSTARPTLRSAMGPSPASIWRVPCASCATATSPTSRHRPRRRPTSARSPAASSSPMASPTTTT